MDKVKNNPSGIIFVIIMEKINIVTLRSSLIQLYLMTKIYIIFLLGIFIIYVWFINITNMFMLFYVHFIPYTFTIKFMLMIFFLFFSILIVAPTFCFFFCLAQWLNGRECLITLSPPFVHYLHRVINKNKNYYIKHMKKLDLV